jgi:transposase-like protein
MIEVLDAVAARRALDAGRLGCPSCGGTLRPWGRTRERAVAGSAGTVAVRLDRGRCRSCQITRLLPAGLVAGRSYPLGVIGAALVATGRGNGYRAVAAELGVPAATVRSWARRARANAERLYRFGVRTVVALEPELLPTTPRASRLGEALEVLSAAAVAVTRRFPAGQPVPLWSTINVLTQGRLLAPVFTL